MKKTWIIEGKFVPLSDDQLKELGVEELAAYTSDKNKAAIESTIEGFDKKIEEATKNSVTKEDYDEFKKTIKNELDSLKLDEEEKTKIHQKHADLLAILKEQGITISSLKASTEGLSDKEKKEFKHLTRKAQFQILLEKGMETDEFKNWFASDMRGSTPKMDAAKVTGLDAAHTGSIFVTEPVDNIRDQPRMQPHMRDFISVGDTDETDITYPEISSFTDVYTLGAQMLAENEEVTDVTFASKEKTSKVVRMGVSMNVSKRWFRGRSKTVIDHVLAQIPDAMMFKEDVQILHGDGSGNNLNGIKKDARSFDLTPKSYTAGQVDSVASWNSGTQALITFTVAHKLLGGDSITIANATEATYNTTHKDILLVDETKIIINLTYVAEADTSAWTGSGLSYWYHLVDGAQEFDVLSAAASILEAGLYNGNVIFVNPQTTKRMGTLKATDETYIGVSRDAAGRLNLDDIPIVSIPVIPAGWFLVGDFSQKNIEIREFTTMSIQFLEDVTTQKQNTIVVLADEEIHLVKYNPKWYIFDRFSTSKTQLETP
jgi:hypothetical protein